jgi:hypothetical protein
MYGMVNPAVEALVTERFGEDTWRRVQARAGIEDPLFVTMKQYPDSVTYGLVGAIAAETGAPVEDLLHAFGLYWIEFAQRGPWGKVMMSAGRDARELLGALDAMHARIALSFPELRPPSFRTREHPEGLLLEYHTERPGLTRFVVGLVEGVGRMYGERVSAEPVATRAAGAPFDTFLVRFHGPLDAAGKA